MTPQKTMTPRAWLLMGFLGLIWGGSFAATRMALTEMGFWTMVAWRVGVACLVLWGYVLASRIVLPRGIRIWSILLTLGLIGNAAPFSLITWGQQTVPSGLAAILNVGAAIFGVLVAAMFFRDERLTLRRLTGVALGVAGVVVAMGVQTLAALDLTAMGQLAIVASTVFYAFAGALGRVALREVAPPMAATGMMTGAALVMVPAAILIEGVPVWSHGANVWLAIAYSSVVATAVAYLLFYALLGRAGSGNATLTTLLVAPVAIVVGAVIFAEALPLRAYAGFALLALGLIILDGRLPAAVNRRFAHAVSDR